MRIFRTSLPVLAFLIGSFLASAQDEKVSLLPKLVVGKTYVLEQKMKTVTRMPLPNLPEPMDQNMEMTMSMQMVVDRVGEDEKKVEISFTDMKMKMDMAGQKMELDAADPAQKAALGGILEMKPTIIYDNEDNFLRLDGLAEQGGPIAQMMSPEMLKQMVNGSMETMPAEPVAVGHSWKSTVELPIEGAGNMTVTADYKFEKMEDVDGASCAVVSFAGDLSGTINPAPGMSMTFEDGLFSGKMYFDPAIGYSRKQNAKTRFVMKMEVPNQKEAITIPMDQDQEVQLIDYRDSAG